MFLTGVTDMVVAETSQGQVLYTTSRFGGGDLLAYRIGGDGGLTLLDSRAMSGEAQAGSTNKLTLVDNELFLTGVQNAALTKIVLGADGRFGAVSAVTGAPMPSQMLTTETVVVNGQSFLYGITRGSDEVGVWRVNDDDSVTLVEGGMAGTSSEAAFTGMSVAQVGGKPFLLVSSAADDALICMSLNSSGLPRQVSRISAADGVGIATPTATAFVELGGEAFGILASSDSGTLSVVRLGADGSMVLTDHVMDTQDTRFDGVHVMETASHSGRAYLAVAGADDGVSVFELFDGGRLSHLTTIADGVGTTLDGVSALSLTVQNGFLHLAVASSVESGLSVFTVDISARVAATTGTDSADVLAGDASDDHLLGGAGNDTLSGNGGDDILSDGAGSDLLIGGAGRDRFIFGGDGAVDTIGDFDITQDSIDLSGWAFLRSNSQITYQGTSDGAQLSFGSETLIIKTANGQSLSADQIASLELVGQSRFMPDWVLPDQPDTDTAPGVPMPLNLIGTPGSDTLTGDNADDIIEGRAANDVLSGMGGDDTIFGEDGNDAAYGNAGSDVIEGGRGDDAIWGGIGWDTLRGNDGHDKLVGGDGFDAIGGGDGNDVLSGNNGADRLYGDNGNDKLVGGLNSDSLWGGADQDTLEGSAGSDNLYGGAGNDQLFGNAGADILEGEAGHDRLSGGINNDTIDGGSGDDTLQGDNGSDVLKGGDGDDLLKGNAGHDDLDGGRGNDVLSGGFGVDRFTYGSGQDRIIDFQNEIDTLVLDSALWGGGALSVSQLATYVTQTTGGSISLDFGNGNILELSGVETVNVLNGDVEFV
ncbi:calcium-binding protein [Roseobacter sp. GAI101]|uniref:calcium-binding protein n=1 Tax=Roseobacter sp. (strain GAI101) TaxID=391589 RepID=UPI0001871FF1|nr:calcium-binding protein [Roseobacter sp. GAI101]EEB83747.1 hypothetical protein RGAI101_896 [Roseobacter sp. GAI101]